MELSQLSARALQINEAFAAHARGQGLRPWTREEVMQGFVGDVGDLMKIVDEVNDGLILKPGM